MGARLRLRDRRRGRRGGPPRSATRAGSLTVDAVLGRWRATVLACALLGSAAACVAEGRPADCAAPSVTRELTLADDRLQPQAPAACRGQEVTLVVESEQEGVLHLHGYEQAAEVAPGETVEFRFTADRPGQFPIELHVSGEPEGRSVGIFTVHEP